MSMTTQTNGIEESYQQIVVNFETEHTKVSSEISQLRRQVEQRKKVVEKDQHHLIAIMVGACSAIGCAAFIDFEMLSLAPLVGLFAAIITWNVFSSQL
jgi:hypothetical protein